MNISLYLNKQYQLFCFICKVVQQFDRHLFNGQENTTTRIGRYANL